MFCNVTFWICFWKYYQFIIITGNFGSSLLLTYFTNPALQPLCGLGLPYECPVPPMVSRLRLPDRYLAILIWAYHASSVVVNGLKRFYGLGRPFPCVQISRNIETKDLDTIFDSSLSFRQEYSYVIDKAYQQIDFIHRLTSDFNDPFCLKQLFVALVWSILEFNVVTWSPHTNKCSIRILRGYSLFKKKKGKGCRGKMKFRLKPNCA